MGSNFIASSSNFPKTAFFNIRSHDLPTLKFILGTLWILRKWKEQERYVELPSLRSVALKYKIWWQFKSQKYWEDLYGKRLLDGKACPPAIWTLGQWNIRHGRRQRLPKSEYNEYLSQRLLEEVQICRHRQIDERAYPISQLYFLETTSSTGKRPLRECLNTRKSTRVSESQANQVEIMR